MNHNCLNCKHWDRLYENPDVGVCELHNDSIIPAYRFQFEDCTRFEQGQEREPYFHLFQKMLVTSSLVPNYQRIEKYYSIPFGVIPQPKERIPDIRRAVKDDQLEQVVTWRREKKSRFWIAQKLGVSPNAVVTAERIYAEKGAK